MEARLLKSRGGAGTINPKTGLPEFRKRGRTRRFFESLFRNTGRGVGATMGNALLPGIGGIIGGALGGAGTSALQGKKGRSILASALKGGAMGAALPKGANLAGKLASKAGATALGQGLTNYGAKNSISTALGLASNAGNIKTIPDNTSSISLPDTSNVVNQEMTNAELMNASNISPKKKGMLQQLMGNTKDMMTNPRDLLTLGVVASSLYKPKPKSAAQIGREQKEAMLASRLTPQELADQEAYELELMRGKRRNMRKRFLPEERIDFSPLYSKIHTPAEYKKHGGWFSYYSNPERVGRPIRF